MAQPVAAGPTKVGEDTPKLVEVMVLLGEFVDWGAASSLDARKKLLKAVMVKIATASQIEFSFALSVANIAPPNEVEIPLQNSPLRKHRGKLRFRIDICQLLFIRLLKLNFKIMSPITTITSWAGKQIRFS